MRKGLVLILLSCVLCLAATAQQPALTVGTATAVTGHTVTGFIEVSAGSDVGTNIPVAVIRGPKPGPTLPCCRAHGTEYASIIALEKLIQELNPADISGTVIIVPLVNIASFEQKVPHVNPVDGKSMNRFYPGNPNGTQTERASWAMTMQVVEKSDYLIDLHGGDLDESLRPYSYWAPTGNAQQDTVSRAMVLAFGLDTSSSQPIAPATRTPPRYLETNASPAGEAVPYGRGGPRRRRRVGGRVGADQRLPERDALPEDVAGRCASGAEPSVDRSYCQRRERNRRRFLSHGEARLVRATRHENRLCHRLVRQDSVGSACAVERRGPLCLRRALNEET